MLRLPSLTKPYHAFVSFDDAIVQPPQLADNASEEQRTEWLKALEDHAAKMRAARQTGDWSAITVDGKTPVRFLLRPMPFDGLAVVSGMRERRENQEDILLLAVRLCLIDIEGIPVKIDFETHERFGKIVAPSTFDKFGAAQGLRIAVELGALAIQRASADPL